MKFNLKCVDTYTSTTYVSKFNSIEDDLVSIVKNIELFLKGCGFVFESLEINTYSSSDCCKDGSCDCSNTVEKIDFDENSHEI